MGVACWPRAPKQVVTRRKSDKRRLHPNSSPLIEQYYSRRGLNASVALSPGEMESGKNWWRNGETGRATGETGGRDVTVARSKPRPAPSHKAKGSPRSPTVADYQDRPFGMFKFRDPNSVPPEKGLDPSGSVVAVFKPHDLGRRSAFLSQIQKVGIAVTITRALILRIFPNRFVRREPGETRVEDVRRTGKKLGEAAGQLGREIPVKQQPQRESRSRPVCEA